MIHQVFDFVGVPILAGIFVILFFLETKYKLRRRVQSRFSRIVINSIVSIPAFTFLRFLFLPAMVWLARENETLHFGLNYLYELPAWLEFAIAFLILDYGNYLWHRLNHKIPLLWRYHLVHHTDPDLDITTAFRFHFGEMIGSIFSRGLVSFLSGASPLTILIYEIIFEAATQFHHTNWKMPFRAEQTINLLIVTPRMHGIHHSIIKGQTDSNYSVIFSFWDRIHKTAVLNVPQEKIVTGVPAYNNPAELTIGYLLTLPFKKIRPWPPVKPDNTRPEKNRNSLEE